MLSKNPSLKEAIHIAKGIDHTAEYVRELKKETEPCLEIPNCNKIHEGNVSKKKQNVYDKDVSKQDSMKLRCYRCGHHNHLANRLTGIAHNVTCSKCSKRGHFDRMCREQELK